MIASLQLIRTSHRMTLRITDDGIAARECCQWTQGIQRPRRELHPYDEPEILATPIVAGSAGYLAWVSESLR